MMRSRTLESETIDRETVSVGRLRSWLDGVGKSPSEHAMIYDAFEAANLWGKNLVDHLADIYANARYVVMFISKEYVEKA